MTESSTEFRSPGFVLGLLIKVGRGPISIGRRLTIIVTAIASLLLLGWVDIVTPNNVHFGLLYVLPVLFTAWYGGRWPGYVLDLCASLVWLKAGRPLTDGPSFMVNGTNLLIRGMFYGLLVELVILLRSVGQQLEQSVRERTAELRQEVVDRLRAEESLRKLAGQLSAAEDAERRRIAYDIHDALSQMLGVVKMNLETVVAETATDSRQFERLTDVVKMVNDLIRQTREMTFDLHPSMLDHFGLVPTLQRFAEEYNRRTLAEVAVNESGTRVVLPSSMASYLFRAIKELVNNSVRHGNAHEIFVAVHWENGHMRTVIDDDGCGFEPSRALAPQARRGLGLAGIDERLTSLGGFMRLESSEGSGTRVVLEVPVAGAAVPVVASSASASSVPADSMLVNSALSNPALVNS